MSKNKGRSGDGSIVKVGKDKYRVFVSLGKDPITGRYLRKSRTVRGNMSDVLKARDELNEQRKSGLRVDTDKITFGEFASQWLEQRLDDPTLAKWTKTESKDKTELLISYIGDLRLTEITPQVVESLCRLIQKDRGIKQTSLRKYFITLNMILSKAVDYEIIMRNPCERVKTPRNEPVDRKALEPLDVMRLSDALARSEARELAAIKNNDRHAFVRYSSLLAVRLALATGMRLSEVLALQWEEINLEKGLVNVCQSLDMDQTIKEPKTKSGKRTITLDSGTLEHLKDWQNIQACYMEDAGARQYPETPVCCSSAFGFIDQANFGRWWRKWRKENGFEGLKFHELRHTQATLLINSGADIKTVQTRLGHSSASLTLDMYAHPSLENDRKASSVIGEIINWKDTPKCPDKQLESNCV